MGNPPYSVGQTSANDNNANVAYPHLDGRIEATYAARSVMTSVKNLYDSYIRAIRWGSDRLGKDGGVMAYVSGNAWAERQFADGMRKCLVEEFSNIHVLNLRGDIRKNMLSKGRAKEGQNIFGSASMTGISIALFVKNPNARRHGQIFYHDIGDDLKQAEKLEKIKAYSSIDGIAHINDWQAITPDTHGDWLSQRDDGFSEFMALGDKKSGDPDKLFTNFSLGIATGRDAWCYNASKANMANNVTRLINFYNTELARFNAAHPGLDRASRNAKIDDFIDTDVTRISWTVNLKQELAKDRRLSFEAKSATPSLYRPFTKQWLYYSRTFNERVYQIPHIFPDAAAKNLVICVSGVGARSGFAALITNALPNLHTVDSGQCFPLYLYDNAPEAASTSSSQSQSLFNTPDIVESERQRRDALTDEGLAHFQAAYPGEQIGKEDVFYYVYGLLHSEDYRDKYADNLSKELPRIPCASTATDFWAFSQAGRTLADLHLNYETVAMYPATVTGAGADDADYRVEKMKYGAKKDLTTLHYNSKITVTGIPLEAYDYVVNGKPALDWVVERQCVKTDKASGIVNDANDWAIDTMHNPRYPLELFLRVITVSLETMKNVRKLPKLDVKQQEPTDEKISA